MSTLCLPDLTTPSVYLTSPLPGLLPLHLNTASNQRLEVVRPENEARCSNTSMVSPSHSIPHSLTAHLLTHHLHSIPHSLTHHFHSIPHSLTHHLHSIPHSLTHHFHSIPHSLTHHFHSIPCLVPLWYYSLSTSSTFLKLCSTCSCSLTCWSSPPPCVHTAPSSPPVPSLSQPLAP